MQPGTLFVRGIFNPRQFVGFHDPISAVILKGTESLYSGVGFSFYLFSPLAARDTIR
jgi:hypothetical protein